MGMSSAGCLAGPGLARRAVVLVRMEFGLALTSLCICFVCRIRTICMCRPCVGVRVSSASGWSALRDRALWRWLLCSLLFVYASPWHGGEIRGRVRIRKMAVSLSLGHGRRLRRRATASTINGPHGLQKGMLAERPARPWRWSGLRPVWYLVNPSRARVRVAPGPRSLVYYPNDRMNRSPKLRRGASVSTLH